MVVHLQIIFIKQYYPIPMKRFILFLATALPIGACTPNHVPDDIQKQTEWLDRTEGFQDKYGLEQLVVLSRHNIRAPLVGKGSVLSRVTDPSYQWFQWEDPASHLTAKGQRLEAQMGTFFREWLTKKGFTDPYSAGNGKFRFYANAKQRCQHTARTFVDAVFPGACPEVEMKVEFDKMDPVFNPQITKLPEGFAEKARQEITARMGISMPGVAPQYTIIENLIGITRSVAYPDTISFSQFPSTVDFKLHAEPFMNGGLKIACTVSDALVLQYHEEPDPRKAAFGHEMGTDDWQNVAWVKHQQHAGRP